MFSRRNFLRLIGAAGAFAFLPKKALSQMPGMGGSSLMPFMDPLRFPTVLKPKKVKGVATYTMNMMEAEVRCHSSLPMTKVWGFNGEFPGPTIVADKGKPVRITQTNNLPETGVKKETQPSVHLHGAHVDPMFDGHPMDGIAFDGGTRVYEYPNEQRGCTMWYHDHSHGLTGERVVKGLAGLYILQDKSTEAKLKLPRGDREVALVIQDRTFDSNGQFVYELTDEVLQMGFHGDNILVNGVVQPYFQVESAKYRFRILNGSNARIYTLAMENGQPLIQIGTDGGLLQRPISHTSIQIAPSERIDIVIDFSALNAGQSVILRNIYEDATTASTSQIMRFDVVKKVKDTKELPATLAEWEEVSEYNDDGSPVLERTFNLARQTINGKLQWTINGKAYQMNPEPLATPALNSTEKWKFVNPTNHPHPMHIHLVQFQVCNINGEPQEASDHGWKDTFVVPPASEVTFIARFSGYTGTYVFHCHNLEHEDFAMMGEFKVVDTGMPEMPGMDMGH